MGVEFAGIQVPDRGMTRPASVSAEGADFTGNAHRGWEHRTVRLTLPRIGDELAAHRHKLSVAAALVLTAAVRIIFLLKDNTLSADEAVTGIMARKIASGSNFYIYFAGQNYNSAVEQYPQAALFALGAPQTAFVLRLPELAISVISCWLTFLVAQRMFSDFWRPVLAALLFAVGPIFHIARGSTTTGSYTAQEALSLLTVLSALALTPTLEHRRRLVAAALIGLALTGTFYLTASGYFLVLPAILWAVPALNRFRLWPAAAVGAAVGIVPPLVDSIRNHSSIYPHIGIRPSTPLSRLQDLLDPVGRMFLGFAHSYGTPGLPIMVARVLLWAGILTLAGTVLAHRRSIQAIVFLRPACRNPVDIAYLALILATVGYVASKYAYFTIDPRYLFTTTPALILGLAALPSPPAFEHMQSMKALAVTGGAARPRRSIGASLVGAALLMLLGAPTVIMLSHPALDSNGNVTALPSTGLDGNMAQAATQLERGDVRYVYSTYWLAVPMDFLAGGRLTAVTYGSVNRFPNERAQADAAPVRDTAWLDMSSSTAMPLALKHHHIRFRDRRFGRITIYDEFTVDVRPSQLGLRGP